MASTINVAPYTTTNAQDSFLLQSDGWVVGTFVDNPALRYTLEGGIVSSSQATPLWGGLPVTLEVPAPGSGGSSSGLGSTILAATASTNIDAWLVLNQASAGVITASSNTPLYPSSTSANYVRSGSGLWVVLPVNPAEVNTIAGGGANQTLYWNFTSNYVDTTGTGALSLQVIALNTNSKTITYNSTTGDANWSTGSVIVCRV